MKKRCRCVWIEVISDLRKAVGCRRGVEEVKFEDSRSW